ncbi:TonB-dependent receptor [Acidomonas methanolica]|nr:TonB-dependent receptor [Acidomonas methanolica]
MMICLLGLGGGIAWQKADAAGKKSDPAGTAAHYRAAASSTAAPEEVTVTARRRTEPIQRVPISITVFNAKQAARDNVHDLQGIFQFIPEANFRTSSSAKDRTLFVRGIGTISTSPGVEPSVSTVIDGVVLARSGQATVDILDLDHIEVLSGPQGTLFGKNASAGVVNIVTARPTAETHVYADARYFSGDEYRLAAGASGTLIPGTLIANASFVVGGYTGNVENVTKNEMVNGYQHRGARTKLVWTPDQKTSVTLGLDYMYSNDAVPNGVFISSSRQAYPTNVVTPNRALASALASEGITPSGDNTRIANNTLSKSVDHNGGAAITLNRQLGGGYTLTAISAYRRWQNIQDQDYDQLSQAYAGLPQLRDHGYLDFWQASQEVRIASPKGHFLDYVAGLYYLHATNSQNYDRFLSPLDASGTHGHAEFGTVGNNYAVFAEGNLNFTKRFRAILGLRLLRDDLSYHMNRQSNSAVTVTGIRPSYASSGSTAHNGYVDRIGLQYDLAQDVNAYFTYSHGYKGPAYNVFLNMQATDAAALKPEQNNSFEIGLKSRWWHRRITANIAAYIENFSNYQANFQDSVDGAIVTRLINAGSVSSKGVETNFSVRPIDGVTLGGNAAYTYAVVDQFHCPVGAALSCNVNGQQLPFAPRWKFIFSGDYTRNLSDRFKWSIDSTYTWQSRTQYQLTETPDTVQKAYGIWNFGTTIEDVPHRLRLTLLMRNALDTHYYSYKSYGNLGGVVGWLPRDFGRYGGFELHKDF